VANDRWSVVSKGRFPSRIINACVFVLIILQAQAADEPWKFHGFLELRAFLFPQKPNPADTHTQGVGLVQASLQRKSDRWGRYFLSVEGEIDTHHDIARNRLIDWNERDLRRSAARFREAYWERRFGPLDLRLGRQEIRWGRADGFNPTDNLEPYDFLSPFVERRMPVTAASGNLYWHQANLEFHWLPLYESSRLPLLGQRWFPGLPSEVSLSGQNVPALLRDGNSSYSVWRWSRSQPRLNQQAIPVLYQEGNRNYPALSWPHSQVGLRWNQIVPGAEFSLSYFDGFNDLPFFSCISCISWSPTGLTVRLDRNYLRQRIIGADFATQLHGWGLRGEAAHFMQGDQREDGYLSYVIGLDRQTGRWFTIIEFAGQWISQHGSAPQPTSFDRGLGRAVLLRTQLDLRTDESLEWAAIVRLPSGDSAWRMTYRGKLSDRWQMELRGQAFAGNSRLFLGQFRDSSHLVTIFTYRW
jgi:hypothetical protein